MCHRLELRRYWLARSLARSLAHCFHAGVGRTVAQRCVDDACSISLSLSLSHSLSLCPSLSLILSIASSTVSTLPLSLSLSDSL